jgi:hypothetical protein
VKNKTTKQKPKVIRKMGEKKQQQKRRKRKN